jgi:2-polyprenyl-6-methoxyphenol hydroxylase-like FAD-dependent oxidoreductase
MKVVIIGGGIAGLAAAISLRRIGFDAVVKERADAFKEVGLGFIILPNGLAALDKLGAGEYVRANGAALTSATLRDDKGKIYRNEDLTDAIAVKRSTCIDGLLTQLPKEFVHHSFDFSHFEYDENGNAVAVVSKKGDKETGDIFIAADGANSPIRQKLFGSHPFRDSVIKELVGIADSKHLAEKLKGQLLKTQSREKGLSIGILPCGESQLIWYIQFNSQDQDLQKFDNETKISFTKQLMSEWPQPINEVLEATDFSKAFLWSTRDMELLPAFHQKNIVLIGDAAHLALPFTSQGTNSALTDAIVLAELLSCKNSTTEKVFTDFREQRKAALEEYIAFGRQLEEQFLFPESSSLEDIPIPLAK